MEKTGGDARAPAAMDDAEPPFSMEKFLDDIEEDGESFWVDRPTAERLNKLLADVKDACARIDVLKGLFDEAEGGGATTAPPCPVCSSLAASGAEVARRLELERKLDGASAELDTLMRDYIAIVKHIAAARLGTPPREQEDATTTAEMFRRCRI